MADIMTETLPEHHELSALTESPGQKRKRDSDSPESQRNKRQAPAANMSATEFIENEMADQSAAANGVNVADFNALQQAAAGGEHHGHDEHMPHEHHPHEHEHHHIPEPHAPEPHHVEEQQLQDHLGPEVQGTEQNVVEQHHDTSDPGNATSTAQAALGMYPTLHVPASTEEQFAAQAAAEVEQHSHENSYNPDAPPPDGLMDDPVVGAPPNQGNGIPGQGPRYSVSSINSNPKPSVGSEEWHKMRKDNHKEVERRRRETINEGINELAKIVPGCEKNKGSILQRAVNFISQLKENEQQNIEKWTLEKLLTEQAIEELSASNGKLKGECERLYRELETWKRVAQNAGLEPPQPTKEEPPAPAVATNPDGGNSS